MKTGLLGGTFDPIHVSHINAALEVKKALGLDRVILIPNPRPHYKKAHADKADRLKMAQLAAQNTDGIEVSDIEYSFTGEIHTADTLSRLRNEYPNDEFYLILGTDAAKKLPNWIEADYVLKNAKIAVISRGGFDSVDDSFIKIEADAGGNASYIVRERISSGESVTGLIDPRVEEYIFSKGLYVSPYPKEEILSMLKKELKKSRFEHTLGVIEAAKRLAIMYGAPVYKAEYAAMLHDCAKYFYPDKMREYAMIGGADSLELENEGVMHAPAGMAAANMIYGINDKEILSAIRWHTIGRKDMSLLDKIIYVADFIEDTRPDYPGVIKAREAAKTSLEKAASECAKSTKEYLLSKGASIHPMIQTMIKLQ